MKLMGVALIFSLISALSSASVLDCSALLSNSNLKSESQNTQTYLSLVRYLVKEKNVLSSSALRDMAFETGDLDPMKYVWDKLSTEDRFAFNRAFNSLKNINWDIVRSELKILAEEESISERERGQAKNNTRSVPANIILKKDFLPSEATVILEEYSSISGYHYIKYKTEVGIRIANLETGQNILLDPAKSHEDIGTFFETSKGVPLFAITHENGIDILDLRTMSILARISKEKLSLFYQGYNSFKLKIFEGSDGKLTIFAMTNIENPIFLTMDFDGNILSLSQKFPDATQVQQLDDGTIYIVSAKFIEHSANVEIRVTDFQSGKEIFKLPPAVDPPFPAVSLKNDLNFHMIKDADGVLFLALSFERLKREFITIYRLDGKSILGPVTFPNPWHRPYFNLYLNSQGKAFFLRRYGNALENINPIDGTIKPILTLPSGANEMYFKMYRYKSGKNAFVIQYDHRVMVIDPDTGEKLSEYDLSSFGKWPRISAFFEGDNQIKVVKDRDLVQVFGPIPENER